MEISKVVIDDIFKCYSVNALSINGETELVFAAEGDGACHVYSGKDFSIKKTLWEGGGGTMSIVSIPDMEGYFFASKGFYSMVDSETSGVYLIRYKDGEFTEERILDIPFLHRFDVLSVKGKRYFIGATIHSGKKDKEDWSNPGKLFVSEIPFNLDEEMKLELILLEDSLFKNHGFNRGVWNGLESVFIASDEGVLVVTPPQVEEETWAIERIFNKPSSDVAAIDLDGDGELEFAMFGPFHGDKMDILKLVDGEYKSVFTYHHSMDFYHAINSGTVNGVPSFVLGARKDTMELYLVQYDKALGKFKSVLLDGNVGSSNARIINTPEGDIIMSANRQIGQAAIYKVS